MEYAVPYSAVCLICAVCGFLLCYVLQKPVATKDDINELINYIIPVFKGIDKSINDLGVAIAEGNKYRNIKMVERVKPQFDNPLRTYKIENAPFEIRENNGFEPIMPDRTRKVKPDEGRERPGSDTR